MKVVAVDNTLDVDSVNSVLHYFSTHKTKGWKFIKFAGNADLLAQLAAQPGNLDEIELVSEGSPVYLDSVAVDVVDASYISPTDFGNGLKGVPGFSAQTTVYLSGCNTGLAQDGSSLDQCIAQTLATASGATVCGAAGYIIGTHARGDEQTFKDVDGESAYKDSRNKRGDACWNLFQP